MSATFPDFAHEKDNAMGLCNRDITVMKNFPKEL